MNIDDQAVTQYNQAIAPLADSLQKASDLLGQIEQPLGQLYQQAEAADDQAAIAHISIAWGLTQDLANQLPPFVDALRAGGAALKEMRDQRNDFARELSDLLQSLDAVNTADPRLKDFVRELKEETREEMYVDAMDWAEEAFGNDLDAPFREFFLMNFDTTNWAIQALLNELRNEGDGLDEYQHDLIQELLSTFQLEVLNVHRG